MTTRDIEDMRPVFESYILTERGRDYLKRNSPIVDATHDYIDHYVQEAWEAWQACSKASSIVRVGPNTPNNDMVICPACTSQFHAVPVNVQSRLQILEPPAAPRHSHVHCAECDGINCIGIQVREALPATGPSPESILRARAEGRAEAFNILIAQDAETFCDEDKYLRPYAIGATGDYGVQWNDAAVREMLHVDDAAYSEIDKLEASYWTQQAWIDDLQMQRSSEWLPIEAAEFEKDGRYILGWFADRPRGIKINESDRPEPWVAAVRWCSDLELWGLPGIGGLMPTKFKRIVGPDGKPVGYIPPTSAPGPGTVQENFGAGRSSGGLGS